MSGHEADWFERQYNPRVLTPEGVASMEGWAGRAAATRRRHPPTVFRYGDHPRETADLFRPASPRGTAIFVHGGYWRAFGKDDFSWVADSFLDRSVSVVVPSYPLCPEVDLAQIVRSTRGFFAHLYRHVLTDAERSAIVVAGHSAGGYLAALHLAIDWTTFGLPADPLRGVLPISGVFRLEPLIPTSMNEALRLDDASAAALGLWNAPLRSRAKLRFAVGEAESDEFHRQSREMAAHWGALDPAVMSIAGRNHFDVIDGLAEPGSRLWEVMSELLGLEPA